MRNKGKLNRPPISNTDFDHWVQELTAQQITNTFTAECGTDVQGIADSAVYEVQHGVADWARTLRSTSPFDESLWFDGLPATVTSHDVGMITGTEDDDPADITSVSQASGVGGRICYGMINHVDVKLMGDMTNLVDQLTSSMGSPSSNIQILSLRYQADHILLHLPNGTEFGCLRQPITRALKPLLERKDLDFEAIALLDLLRKRINRADKAGDAIVPVDINVYGPRDKLDDIGKKFSSQKIWLQRPRYHKKNILYENPHVIRFPDLEDTMQLEELQNESLTATRRTEDQVLQMVSEIHASTHRAQDLERVSGDRRLLTRLLEHQERALSFMIQRESGQVPEKFRLWKAEIIDGREMFIHSITKTRRPSRPEEKGGGVLADEMGMGKSLSILALIIKTIEDGQEWAEKNRNETHADSEVKEYTQSTLIVVPSALLVNNWMNEIKLHLGDAVKVIRYHGHGRERDLRAISRSDIVITTYKTLATDDASNKSPLHSLGWFRVVLDEAHNIRRTTTTFHRTCAALNSRASWCLTGTPIQNRLEDIGALFAFIKAEPFQKLSQFRRFLVAPFEQGNPIAKERLIDLYDSLVLRRTKDILKLPGQEERVRKLRLTPEEKAQYKYVTKVLDRYIRQQVGEHEVRSKFGLFQAHLQLRILCNHGTHQKIFSWKKRSIEDEKQALLAELGLNAERQCAMCRQPRPIIDLGNVASRFVEDCAHILCSDCLDDYDSFRGGNSPVRHCPLCESFGRSLHDASSQSPTSGLVDGRDIVMQDADTSHDGVDDADSYFNPSGHSTKIRALIQDVKDALQATVSGESGRNRTSKSIIFSCWTRTLDLIQIYLRREGIDFLRIDGECPPSKRQRILDQFARPGGPRVMLMTTGTGAFGLNLTSANHIFIVELQWNPSVENQAVARAIRLRQTDKVIVTRYIMLETVEQEMKSQQFKKQLAAQAGFE
ncbi:Fc.00g058610.m01.CDS01 [Cosmosporella sp. VM-42]